jgi:hypothetical protein
MIRYFSFNQTDCDEILRKEALVVIGSRETPTLIWTSSLFLPMM